MAIKVDKIYNKNKVYEGEGEYIPPTAWKEGWNNE